MGIFKKEKHFEEYTIDRGTIYAGVVIKLANLELNIFNMAGQKMSIEELEAEGIKNIGVSDDLICRKILFSRNENNLAEDLLYYSPNYAIEGYKPKAEVDNSFLITRAINLEELLIYFQFKRDLTEEDIRIIYSLFLKSDDFYHQHCRLFGVNRNLFGKERMSKEPHDLPYGYYMDLSYISSLSKKPSKDELGKQPAKVKIKTYC